MRPVENQEKRGFRAFHITQVGTHQNSGFRWYQSPAMPELFTWIHTRIARISYHRIAGVWTSKCLIMGTSCGKLQPSASVTNSQIGKMSQPIPQPSPCKSPNRENAAKGDKLPIRENVPARTPTLSKRDNGQILPHVTAPAKPQKLRNCLIARSPSYAGLR